MRRATSDTPKSLFPKRRVGSFAAGSEASFIVLRSDPLSDLAALDGVVLRVRGGELLSPPALAGRAYER